MGKGTPRFSEIFTNEWGRDVAAARRAAELARVGNSQLEMQSAALDFARISVDQQQRLIAQNDEMIALLRYMADVTYEEKRSAG